MKISNTFETLVGEFQNITGQLSATFPNSPSPGVNPFSRAPYQSERIRSTGGFVTVGYIEVNTSSGSSTNSPLITSDHRTLSFLLKDGIKSGTYTFPSPTEEIKNLSYGEYAKTGDNYNLIPKTATEATLELEVSPDGQHIKSKRFDIVVNTNSGKTLSIKADFDIYITIE